jgi:hypothetical protein
MQCNGHGRSTDSAAVENLLATACDVLHWPSMAYEASFIAIIPLDFDKELW